RRRGVRPTALPQEEAEAGEQRHPATGHRRLPVRVEVALPAGQGGGAERRVSLHLHRQGAEGGDGRDPGWHLAGPGRSSRGGRPACDRRQRDVAGLPGEGAEPAVGAASQENPPQGVAETAGGLRQVLSLVSHFRAMETMMAMQRRWSLMIGTILVAGVALGGVLVYDPFGVNRPGGNPMNESRFLV